MCGISGGYVNYASFEGQKFSDVFLDIEKLMELSQKRGQDSAGILYFDASSGEKLGTCKVKNSAQDLISSKEYKVLKRRIASNRSGKGRIFLSHARLATNSLGEQVKFIQPLEYARFSGIHNGIITEIAGKPIPLEIHDSNYFFKTIEKLSESQDFSIKNVSELFGQIYGSVSAAIFWQDTKLLQLFTNNGSLYYVHSLDKQVFYFSSERSFLSSALKKSKILKSDERIYKVQAGSGLIYNPSENSIEIFKLKRNEKVEVGQQPEAKIFSPIEIQSTDTISNLKRCKNCILPATYPLIEFDNNGVCNFCHRYEKQEAFGEESLLKFLDKYRSRNESPDCLVGLSGGRDSCYGLHLLKTKFGMNPIAYTFDWGLTTDVSRRNQSRMCAQLGVEHIVRSANLRQKRSYIQKNVNAFLKKPHLGMVPLFMAGDKEFYQYGRTLKAENNILLTVYCAGQSLEQREFMTGFCGVDENIKNNKRLFDYTFANKVKLALFYAKQYSLNPSYLNQSFLDSVMSFFYSFLFKDDFLYLYEYIPWNEYEIEKTLREKYAWESDLNYGKNQWRMGDGQTAFTNYIYYSVAGFSEFDNFRSNQIREGLLSRDQALKLVAIDNQPKMQLLNYFAEVVGLDLNRVLSKINQIPKLY